MIHAPNYGTRPDCDPIDEPLCGTKLSDPRVAEPEQLINCQACLTALWKRPQWLHRLVSMGYRVGNFRKRKPRTPKTDPRQLNFGDLFERDDK